MIDYDEDAFGKAAKAAGDVIVAVDGVLSPKSVVVANNHIGYEINQPTADRPTKEQ